MPGELVKPRRLVAHRSCLFLGLSCQFSSQCRCSPYLLGHLVRFLFVLLCLPHVLSPGSSGSIPPLGSSIVVHDLHPRIFSDREYLGVNHSVCVNEDDFACRDFAKAEACRRTICRQLVLRLWSCPRALPPDWPRVPGPLHRPSLSLQSFQPSCCNLRLRVNFPFLTHQELKHLPRFLQILLHVLHSRLHVVKLTWSTFARQCVNTCSFLPFRQRKQCSHGRPRVGCRHPALEFSCLPSRAEVGENLNSSSYGVKSQWQQSQSLLSPTRCTQSQVWTSHAPFPEQVASLQARPPPCQCTGSGAPPPSSEFSGSGGPVCVPLSCRKLHPMTYHSYTRCTALHSDS